MPAKEEVPVPAIVRDPDGKFIHYGFEYEGAFHPIASEGAGNYDERVKAAQESEG